MADQGPFVVDATWLKEKLDDPSEKIVVLDGSYSRQRNMEEEYYKSHISGARYFNIMHEVSNTDDFPSNITTADDFQEYARSLGVNDDSHVVLYDNSGDGGMYFGGRAWYLFKLYGLKNVSVLDNGMHDWVEKGFPTTSEVPAPPRGNFTAKRRNDIYTTFETMEANVSSRQLQVLDSRPAHLYHGKADDPRSGHYPGAVSVPFGGKLLDPATGRFKTAEQLKNLFEEEGIDLSKPVVASCRTGMSACSLMMALIMAGAKDYSMYHGSATQWLRNAKLEDIERS